MQQHTVYFNLECCKLAKFSIIIQLIDHAVTYLLFVMSLQVIQICRLEFTELFCMSLRFIL